MTYRKCIFFVQCASLSDVSTANRLVCEYVICSCFVYCFSDDSAIQINRTLFSILFYFVVCYFILFSSALFCFVFLKSHNTINITYNEKTSKTVKIPLTIKKNVYTLSTSNSANFVLICDPLVHGYVFAYY